MVSVVRMLLLTIYSCLFYMKPPVKQYYSWMQCTTLRSDVPSMKLGNWESKWGLLINNQWSKNLYIPQNPDIFTQLSLRLRVSFCFFFFTELSKSLHLGFQNCPAAVILHFYLQPSFLERNLHFLTVSAVSVLKKKTNSFLSSEFS